jgi:hypothetical protein
MRAYFIPTDNTSIDMLLGILNQEIENMELFEEVNLRYVAGYCTPENAKIIASTYPTEIKSYGIFPPIEHAR